MSTVPHNRAPSRLSSDGLHYRVRDSEPDSVHALQFICAIADINVYRIGSGTGIFTRALLAHPDWSGSTIGQLRAVEPSEGMREQFSKTVTDARVTVAEGTFDRTGVEDGWADLVVVAQVRNISVPLLKSDVNGSTQAFHWCPDYDKAAYLS